MNRSIRLAGWLPTWLRFSLRALFILVVLAAIPAKLAALIHEYHSEQRLLAEFGAPIYEEGRISPFL